MRAARRPCACARRPRGTLYRRLRRCAAHCTTQSGRDEHRRPSCVMLRSCSRQRGYRTPRDSRDVIQTNAFCCGQRDEASYEKTRNVPERCAALSDHLLESQVTYASENECTVDLLRAATMRQGSAFVAAGYAHTVVSNGKVCWTFGRGEESRFALKCRYSPELPRADDSGITTKRICTHLTRLKDSTFYLLSLHQQTRVGSRHPNCHPSQRYLYA